VEGFLDYGYGYERYGYDLFGLRLTVNVKRWVIWLCYGLPIPVLWFRVTVTVTVRVYG